MGINLIISDARPVFGMPGEYIPPAFMALRSPSMRAAIAIIFERPAAVAGCHGAPCCQSSPGTGMRARPSARGPLRVVRVQFQQGVDLALHRGVEVLVGHVRNLHVACVPPRPGRANMQINKEISAESRTVRIMWDASSQEMLVE